MDSVWGDGLDREIAESMKDPEIKAAWEGSQRWHAEAERYECPNGCCASFVHPTDDERQSGWGPVGCPYADDGSAVVRATWTLEWECRHKPRCADAACSYNPAMRLA